MVTHEEMGRPLRQGDNTPRFAYRYVDAHRRKRKLLNTPPDKETTLRAVSRLLAGLRRLRPPCLPSIQGCVPAADLPVLISPWDQIEFVRVLPDYTSCE
jgi:hypothetical protein